MIIISTVLIYFALLFLISHIASKRSDNTAFFRGERRSPWYLVAFGMVGASISGVTFVSVPGMVTHSGMTYLQTCLGFIVGYFVVALVLLPIYYRLNLTSIYTYLGLRMGNSSHKTAAWFFLFSKMTGAALRFYIPCLILQQFVLGKLGIPFAVTAAMMVLLIWLYTRRSGIKTLVWTDALQTLCLITALLLIIYNVARELGMDFSEAAEAVMSHPNSRVFVFDDWRSTQNFWKQFVSGIFIVVVMTGLDQDMMQKNLTCKSLRDAQKDMCAYGFAFLPVNLLFLSLGILLMILASQKGISLPDNGDQLLPLFAATGDMGTMVTVLFAIGIVAASFSSADSAITSMTTSYCVDIEEKETDEKLRRKTHWGICFVFALFVIMTNAINSKSIIDTVYVVCSYTYGPLLGMFAFSILTKRKTNDRLVPLIAIGAPMVCFAIDRLSVSYCGYKFGYELLMVNGLMVYLALLATSRHHSGNRRLRRE